MKQNILQCSRGVGRRGFTLVELSISIGIFTVLVSIATSAVIQAFRVQRQVAGLIAANNNVSLTIEQIAREMRTGSGFSSSGANSITFTNAKRDEITYRLNINAIERGVKNPGQISVITANNVLVKYLNFSIFSPPDFPPRITISIGISPKEQMLSGTVINLQTTVSPRFL